MTVVGIHQGKSLLRKPVEEILLGSDVFFKGLMIIEVIMGDVGKHAAGKMEAGNPFLHYCVRADFHKYKIATGIYHFVQHPVNFHGIGRCMAGRQLLLADFVNNSRKQAGPVTQSVKQLVQQSGNRSFTVGTGNPHQFQLFRWLVVKIGGHLTQRQG